MKSLYLLNKDLRLKENRVIEVLKKSKSCAFVYWLKKDFKEMGEARLSFLIESLLELEMQLNEVGHKLYFINSLEELDLKLFDQIYFSKVYNSKEQKEFETLKEKTCQSDTECFEVENSTLYALSELPFSLEMLPKGFTSFRKKIEKKQTQLNKCTIGKSLTFDSFKPIDLEHKTVSVLKERLERLTKNDMFTGGEKSSLEHLKNYFWNQDRARTYKETRNGMIDFFDSTKFSPWMALGSLSPITVMNELLEYEEQVEKNESTYWIYFELMWREYFKLYSLKFGDKIFNLNGLGYKAFYIDDVDKDGAYFNQWARGETKEPFVNANMIELHQTGWMSNRGRQNVASYLAKHMFLDWRLGAKHFEKYLIDFDVESNWGNWNYNAGVGSDPRDRIFNIKKQADMYDPDHEYQSAWLIN